MRTKLIIIGVLCMLFTSVASADTTEAKIDSLLSSSDPFTADITALNNVGSIYSDDNKLRIVSWNNRNDDGTFSYNCYFIYRKRSGKKAVTYKLSASNAVKPTDNGSYGDSNWYGSLYYNAYAVKGGYILLGYQTYRDISRVKVIEPLKISEKAFSLGNKVFDMDGVKTSRVVFEYSPNAIMSINYDGARRTFTFDNLSPENPNLRGMYQYYGPDFTYNSLILKKKRWTLVKNVDARNNE